MVGLAVLYGYYGLPCDSHISCELLLRHPSGPAWKRAMLKNISKNALLSEQLICFRGEDILYMRSESLGTRVFHIVFFDYDYSAYIHFFDCNFKCRGCLRKLSIWDCHLPDEVTSKLTFKGFLSLRDLEDIILRVVSEYHMKKAVLGGGEPTTDPSLIEVLRMLKRLNLDIVVLTNAYRVNEDLLKEFVDPKVIVIVSIKSIDPTRHEMYTGFPLEPVLNNLARMYSSGTRLLVETIVIPGFNDANEVGLLAKFIASIDRSIPLIIDSFIPVPGAPWRRTTLNDLREAEETALRYLENVYGRGKAISEGMRGRVYLIYPQLE